MSFLDAMNAARWEFFENQRVCGWCEQHCKSADHLLCHIGIRHPEAETLELGCDAADDECSANSPLRCVITWHRNRAHEAEGGPR